MASVFPNVYVTPIYLPQKQFTDSYGNANAYISMNPSLFISPDGEYTLLIRNVNYRKYANKQFTLYERPWSVSKYTISRGQMQTNKPFTFDAEIDDLVLEYNQPTFSSYWKGMEDIRFVTKDEVLVTIPEMNPGGNPSIFLGKIEDNHISYCIPCEPSITEKNWMPFIHNEQAKVIYSIDPFMVKDIFDAELTQVDTRLPPLDGYHGSTNGLPYRNGYLFLIHQNRDISYHRWLYYNPQTEATHISDEFIFFRHTYIEFPCSLCEWEGRIFVSMGVNDDSAFILELRKTDIDSSLSIY
jgi:hypothetical protein